MILLQQWPCSQLIVVHWALSTLLDGQNGVSFWTNIWCNVAQQLRSQVIIVGYSYILNWGIFQLCSLHETLFISTSHVMPSSLVLFQCYWKVLNSYLNQCCLPCAYPRYYASQYYNVLVIITVSLIMHMGTSRLDFSVMEGFEECYFPYKA